MKNYRVTFLFVVAIIATSFTFIQSNNTIFQTIQQPTRTNVEWLSFEEAVERSEKDGKKIMIEIYTEWCTWCKRMDTITLEQPAIATYINDNFYAVKFDAETQREITFKERQFEFIKRGKKGYHSIVAELLKGHRLIYPSFVFLDGEQRVIQVISKYRSPQEFERIISYFGQDHHKRTPWSVYRKSYKSTLISNDK
ncbi:MAG: DUF255 domain-containing protein [Bacteroidota bacterium]